MYPHERSLVNLLAGKPFAIVGVNSDDNLAEIRKITKEKHITWRSFWNGPQGTQGPISTQWGVTGWPTTYLIDKDGVIRYKNVRGKALDAAIEVLLKEMGEEVSLVDVDHEALDAKAREEKVANSESDEGSKEDPEPKSEQGEEEAAKGDSLDSDKATEEKNGVNSEQSDSETADSETADSETADSETADSETAENAKAQSDKKADETKEAPEASKSND